MLRIGFRIRVADLFTVLLIVSILVVAAALATRTNVISGIPINVTPTPVIYPHSGQSYIPSIIRSLPTVSVVAIIERVPYPPVA